jgi:hypothetical protein
MSKESSAHGSGVTGEGDGEKAVRGLEHLPSPLFRTLLAARSPSPETSEQVRRAVADVKIDWPAIADVVDTSGIGPLAITRMKELSIDAHLAPETVRAWEADRLHAQLQCVLQRRDALRITERLTERGIRHAFIKGFAVREWLYRPTWVRASSDSDILIAPEDVERTREALRTLDFVQASRTSDFRLFRPATRWEIEQTEDEHYELAQFARILKLENSPEWLMGSDFRRQAPSAFEMTPSGPVLNSVVDVHWALHFLFAEDLPLDSLTAVPSEDGSLQIPTLSNEWHLLYTAFKLYFESFDRPGWGLHMLADLAALLQVGSETLDWGWLEAHVGKKDLDAMLFYTLSAAERVLGESIVPGDMMERLALGDMQRSEPCNSQLDCGDFMPYVLRRRIPSSFLELVRE